MLTGYEESTASDPFGELVPYAEPAWYHGYASPYYKESHRRLRDAIRTYVDSKLMANMAAWDEAKITPEEVYRDLGAAGFHLASIYPLPAREDVGELTLPGGIPLDEWDAFHDFIFTDEMSRTGSVGFSMAMFSGNQIGLPPVIKFAAPHLRKEIVGPVLRGEKRICVSLSIHVCMVMRHGH